MKKIQSRQKIFNSPVQPIELCYDRISVRLQTKNKGIGRFHNSSRMNKILKECSGKFSPYTFTTIVGPSGCGKTTMLNLLSGRLQSTNLVLYGNLFINGKQVPSINMYKSLIGYVMQDDLILPTFTPRETFKFVADLRLGNKTEEEKDMIVNDLLNSLGLNKCADTYVGNHLIKGISGGERKRTSIGMELLVNPSLIFLDEPTTGLDSTTALNLIRLLKSLANNGRTIISTIHQPSSEIFQQFEKLMLMVDGNIIYNGDSASSIEYFKRIDIKVPVHKNPIDHYMKMMNKEGLILNYIENGEPYTEEEVEDEFRAKVQSLVKYYKENEEKLQIKKKKTKLKKISEASWVTQFLKIARRTVKNEYRDPTALKGKVLQIIFYAVMSLLFFERIATNKNSFVQNLMGIIFYLGMCVSLPATFGTLEVFNGERPVFIRERQSNTYSTSSYFFARTVAYIPQQFILPFIFLSIVYFVVHLNETEGSFFLAYLTMVLISWMGSAYGLLLSAIFKDLEVALALLPVLIAPYVLVGGYFAPLSEVHDFYKSIEYFSLYKFGYEAMAYSQFYDGFNATGTYNGNFTFMKDPFWLSFLMMTLLGLVIRLFTLLVMYIIGRSTNADLIQREERKEEQNVIQSRVQIAQN